MSTVIHPVGPEEPKVYWVRRLVVVLVAVVLVVLAAALISSMFGDDADADPETPAVEGSEEAADGDAPATPATPVACEPGQLALLVTTPTADFPAGTPVTFTVTITNSSAVECTVDAGEASRGILVTSGSDRIWSNLDCPAEGTDERVLLLPPNGGTDVTDTTWGRIRSDEACTANLPEPRPGTYKAVVTLNGATSEQATFTLG